MGTLYGPWSDSRHYRDPAMLATLARHSADMLRGVLLNRNLDPGTLAELAGRVRWTATLARSEPELARDLLAGRRVDDQVILATAMIGGHSRWVECAAEHLSLHAARILLTEPPARNGVLLAQRIRYHEMDRLSHDVDTDTDLEAYLALLDHDDAAWEFRQALMLQHAAGDPQALLALTASMATWDTGAATQLDTDAEIICRAMANLDEESLNDMADIALLCTYGHPQVVRHWATHAGSFGVRVAALDYRQDPAWLATLRGLPGAEQLTQNPALSTDEHIKAHLDEFAAALFDNSRHDDLQRLANQTIQAARERPRQYRTVGDLTVEQQCVVVDNRDATLLAQFEIVAAGAVGLSEIAHGLDTVLEFAPRFRPAAPLLTNDVINHGLFYERAAAQGLRPDLYREEGDTPGDDSVLALADWADTAWCEHTFDVDHGVRVPTAGAIAQVLTSAAELTRLANREWDTKKVANLAQAVAHIAATKAAGAAAMNALLPNALGALT